MGGIKNPFGGGNIGTGEDIGKYGFGAIGAISGDSITDPAGMQQYTDLANQAQQEYGNQRKFMSENVDSRRKDLLSQLAAQANGTAPSIAEAQLKGAFDKSLQQQLALARSNRSGNAGLANRNVSNSAAQQAQNLAQQSAIARMQEQQMGQQGLQSAIQNEQAYATGTLGSALGSQANVAQMQQGMRDRRDARNGQILNAGAQLLGMGFAEGGQVPDLEKILKTRYTKAPKKMAYGGQYTADVGDASKFAADSNAQAAKGQQSQQAAISGITKSVKGNTNKKVAQAEEDDYQALDELVADMGETNKIDAQQQTVSSFVPRTPLAQALPQPAPNILGMQQNPNFLMGLPAYNQGGSVYSVNVGDVSGFAPPPKEDKKEKGGGMDMASMAKLAPMAAGMPPMSKGGNVPGKAQTPGDSLKNDKVPALLSPGEVVVPRSVVEQGHVASAYFVKKATEDANYNAKDFKAEKPSLAKMLKEIQDGEEQFKKVKNIIKKGK